MQRPSQIVFPFFPRAITSACVPWGIHAAPNLGREVNIEFIRKDHHLMRLQVFVMEPNTSQTGDPVRVVILGHELARFTPSRSRGASGVLFLPIPQRRVSP